jgi:hypothetical protein
MRLSVTVSPLNTIFAEIVALRAKLGESIDTKIRSPLLTAGPEPFKKRTLAPLHIGNFGRDMTLFVARKRKAKIISRNRSNPISTATVVGKRISQHTHSPCHILTVANYNDVCNK